MTNIKLTVTGAQARASVTGPLTSGMVGLPVAIEYDEAWDALTKNLICRCSPWGSNDGEYRAILNVGETAAVAHEVMQPDMYLYLGLEGFREDGTLVMPTTWACCGKIAHGASTCGDPSTAPSLSVWNQLQVEMEQLQEQAAEVQACAQEAMQAAEESKEAAASAGDGLSKEKIHALYGMFKVCLYNRTEDVDGAISTFETVFGITGGGVTPDEPDAPDPAAHAITYALTNVALSNTAASVADGASYSAELTVSDPLKLTSISITMGGVDITDSAYGDGYILIQAVTGDVVITAVAAELEYLDTVNCGTVTTIFFYTDDGTTADGYVNNLPLTVSADITESNADVVAIVTNSGNSDVSTTVHTGSVAAADTISNYNLNYATRGSSITIRAGQSVEVPFTVHAGHRAGVCTSDKTVAAAITGKLDVHEVAPLTVVAKTVGSTIYFYADTDTEQEPLSYVWSGTMAVTQAAYDADTTLRITIRNGTSADFKSCSFWCGAVASPDFSSGNVLYAHKQTENGIAAGLYMVFAYTVPAGYYAMVHSSAADAEIIIEEVG